MSERKLKEFQKRFDIAAKNGIILPEEIISDEKIRGIYGIFKIDDRTGVKTCIYVGKANSILIRFLGGSGHINYVIKGFVEKKTVPKNIDRLLKDGYKIECMILEKVPYDRKKTFEYNANYLCYKELEYLLRMQEENQCESQLSESVKKNEIKDWNDNQKDQ